MSRTSLLVALAAAAALLLTGCGEGGVSPAQAPPSPVETSADDGTSGDSPENSALSDPVSAVEAQLGELRSTDRISFETSDGYRGVVTVEWFEGDPSSTGILQGCQDIVRANGSRGLDGLKWHAVTARVAVEHQASNGFEWPSDRKARVNYGDGSKRMGSPPGTAPELGGCDSRMDSAKLNYNKIDFAPGDDPAIVQFVRAGKPSPNNPNGTSKWTGKTDFNVFVPGCDDGDCKSEYTNAQ